METYEDLSEHFGREKLVACMESYQQLKQQQIQAFKILKLQS